MNDHKQVSGVPLWLHEGQLYVRAETFAAYAARSEPNLAAVVLKEIVALDEGRES